VYGSEQEKYTGKRKKKWLSFKKELTASADETSFTYVCQHLHSNRIPPELKNRHLCQILEIGLQQ